MKNILLGIVLTVALIACSEQKESASKAAAEKAPAAQTQPVAQKEASADVAAGKAIAERDCKTCHGLDGKGVAPGIPHLAAQRVRYLLAALTEYKQVKRTHAALKELFGRLSEPELRNAVAYYASQPPVANVLAANAEHATLLEKGKVLAADCVKCHGEDGNSKIPGTPSLAGQQPHYLVTAIQEYHQGGRKTPTMKSRLTGTSKIELENLALYFASQTPAERKAPPVGDPAAGEPLSAVCGGCHGPNGVSADAETPSLAGQDAQYLVKAVKAYRTTRRHWGMQRFVAGLSDKDIENIVAYYVVQKPRAADTAPSSAQELAEKCNRCHDAAENPKLPVPILRGQDKDYLVMALRAYRDDKRESSMMHKMSTIYSNAIIDNIATYYASQPHDR